MTDVDTPVLSGGQLIIAIDGGPQAGDRFTLKTGLITVLGSTVSFGGIAVGTFATGSSLTVSFNAAASLAAVQAVVRSVAYDSTSSNPASLTRQVKLVLTDGAGGTSAQVFRPVLITPFNDPPFANGGGNRTLPATSTAGADVVLDGSASTDPENAPLTYVWTGPFGTRTGAITTVTVPVGVSSVTLTVTDTGGKTGTNVFTVTVTDATPPTIIIAVPSSTATYVLNQPVSASFACADVGSGIATCQGTVAKGQRIDTSTVGPHTFTVTATDVAGNTTTENVTYTVLATPPGPVPDPRPLVERIYTASEGSASVDVVDPQTMTVVRSIPTAVGPAGYLAATPDATRIYASLLLQNRVYVIDTATNTVVTTVPVGARPNGIAVTPDGTRVYVANAWGPSISVIDTSTNQVIQTMPLPAGPQSYLGELVITPDGRKAYVADSDRQGLHPIDLLTNTIGAMIPTNGRAWGLAVSPTGDRLYACQTGAINVLDVASDTIIETFSAESNCSDLAISLDGRRLFMTRGETNRQTTVFDTVTGLQIASLSNGGIYPSAVALNAAGTLAYSRSGFYVAVINVATLAITNHSVGSGAGGIVLVRVVDPVPPVITTPGDLTVPANAPGGAVVTFNVTATDNFEPAPVVSCLAGLRQHVRDRLRPRSRASPPMRPVTPPPPASSSPFRKRRRRRSRSASRRRRRVTSSISRSQPASRARTPGSGHRDVPGHGREGPADRHVNGRATHVHRHRDRRRPGTPQLRP